MISWAYGEAEQTMYGQWEVLALFFTGMARPGPAYQAAFPMRLVVYGEAE
jgi:hypothetical protein